MGVRTLPWGGSCWSKVQSLSRSWHKGCKRAHFYRRNWKAGRSNAQVGRTCHFERRQVTVWVEGCLWESACQGLWVRFWGPSLWPHMNFILLTTNTWKIGVCHVNSLDFQPLEKLLGPCWLSSVTAPCPLEQITFPTCYMFSGLLQASLLWSFMSPSSLLYTT